MEGRIRLRAADSGVLPSGAGAGRQWQWRSIRGADATPNRPGVHTGGLLVPRRYKGISFKLERVVVSLQLHTSATTRATLRNIASSADTKIVDVLLDAG
jgi:hypothetical protein